MCHGGPYSLAATKGKCELKVLFVRKIYASVRSDGVDMRTCCSERADVENYELHPSPQEESSGTRKEVLPASHSELLLASSDVFVADSREQ